MIANKWQISSAMLLLVASLLSSTHAQNESFPYYGQYGAYEDLLVAGLLDQRVYLSPSNSDSNTYYSLTIRQEEAQLKQNVRVGIQWLRDVTNQESFDYRGAIIQVYTEFGTTNPTITIQDALDYNIYRANGGTLTHNEYLNAVVEGTEVGFFTGGGSRFLRNVRAQVIKNEYDTVVKISFTIPGLDPIGDSRLWYRWAFFNSNDGVKEADIRGHADPYFYSTYASIVDFYRTDEFLNIFYIMLGTSVFWLWGWPFMYAWGWWLYIKYIIQSFEVVEYFQQWPRSEEYMTDLYVLMGVGFLEVASAVSIMQSVALIPLFSLPIDFLVVLYMHISYQYQGGTTDKRLYYKTMSKDYQIPEIIDHDAFFDIHFRGQKERFEKGEWDYEI